MGNEWLHEELSQITIDRLDFLLLARSSCNPGFGLRPCLVEGEEPALASSLDQLIWLSHQLQSRLQQPWECSLCLVKDAIDVFTFWEVKRSQTGRWVVLAGGLQRCWSNDWGASEVIVENGLAVGLEDGFGGHCRSGEIDLE